MKLFTALTTLALLGIAPAEAGVIAKLGTTSLTVGPAAGSGSVVLSISPSTSAWTASNNVSWLQLNPTNESGTGSANVIFSFQANTTNTRTGTLTIAGLTLTVTQAGSNYVLAQPVTPLIPSGLDGAEGVAVDAAGNVYVADGYHNAIKEWLVASNTTITLYTNGLNFPEGIAVDASNNVYFADSGNNMIKEWIAATRTVTNLVTSGLSGPFGVAVDAQGDVYIADAGHNAIKEWVPGSTNTILVYSNGTTLNSPQGVALDIAGNLYIADHGNQAVKKLAAGSTNLTLVVSPGTGPEGVAVDGSGNVYYAATAIPKVEKWTAATGSNTTLVASNLALPSGVAVDRLGNVYFANFTGSNVLEQPAAYVNTSQISISSSAGLVRQELVLPRNQNLLPPFAPTSNQKWLSIVESTDGYLTHFAFPNTTGSNRFALVSFLGTNSPVTQSGSPPVIYTNISVGTNNANALSPSTGAAGGSGGPVIFYNTNMQQTNIEFGFIVSDSTTLGCCTHVPPITNWGIEWAPLDPDPILDDELEPGAYFQIQTITAGDNPLETINLIKGSMNTMVTVGFPNNADVSSFSAIGYLGTNVALPQESVSLVNGSNVACYIWPNSNDLTNTYGVILPIQGVEVYSNWYVEPFWTPRMVSFSLGGAQQPCDGILIYPNIPVSTSKVTNITYLSSSNTLIPWTNEVVAPLWLCYCLSNGVSQDVLQLTWAGGFGVLQSSTNLTDPSSWCDMTPCGIDPTNIVIIPDENPVNTYYRVRQPIGDEPGFQQNSP